MDNEVHDVHKEVKDIKQMLTKTRQFATLRVQQMHLELELFHGLDDIIEEVTHLLMEEKISCVCILGSGKSSVSLDVVDSLRGR